MQASRPQFLVRLLPSLADFAFLTPMVFLFGRMHGLKSLLSDGDTGWHIRTGEWILAHGRIPTRDIFSFSKPGQPWFAWEWLSAVGFSIVYRAAGMKGLGLLSAIVIALANIVLLRHMVWRGANFLVSIVAIHLGVAAASIQCLARHH